MGPNVNLEAVLVEAVDARNREITYPVGFGRGRRLKMTSLFIGLWVLSTGLN